MRPSDQVGESWNVNAARDLSFGHSLTWSSNGPSNVLATAGMDVWYSFHLISLSLKQCQTVKGVTLLCRFTERRSMKSTWARIRLCTRRKIAMKISQAARFGEFGKFKGKTIGASRWHSLTSRPDPSSFSVPVMPVQRQVVPVVPVVPAQRQLMTQNWKIK